MGKLFIDLCNHSMNDLLKTLGAATGGAAQVMTTGSVLAALMGAVYTIDCRIMAGNNYEKATNCYLVGLPLMGIGVAGKSGFKIGYDTYNPALKRPEDEEKPDKPSNRTSRTKASEPNPRGR